MQEIDFNNVSSIVSFGRQCQNRLADVNACVAKESLRENYGETAKILEELKSLACDSDKYISQDKESYFEGLRERITESHRAFLMQSKTYEQLAKLNDVYIKDLVMHIEHAKILASDKSRATLYAESVLRKRIKELELTKTVAVNFTAQIELMAQNSLEMASKMQNTLMTLFPLLNSQVIFAKEGENDKVILKTIRKSVDAWEKEITKNM